MTPFEFCRNFWQQKTRVPALSYGVACVILCLAVLVQCRLVTDRQTDRQTDRRTDGRTDGQTHDDSIYRASIASRGNYNQRFCWLDTSIIDNNNNNNNTRRRQHLEYCYSVKQAMKVRTLTVTKHSGNILGISKMDSLPTHSDRNAVCLSFANHRYLVCGWSNVFGQILPSYWLDARACVRFVKLWLVSRCKSYRRYVVSVVSATYWILTF